MRTAIIFNPVAGDGKYLTALGIIQQEFPGAKTYTTNMPGDAQIYAEEALQQKYERIIIAGGDGTIGEVANTLATTDIPLGIIPLGTSNILAQRLGIDPDNLQSAFKIIENGHAVKIDLGKANGRYFSLMAGVGFSEELMQQLGHRLKDSLSGPKELNDELGLFSVEYRHLDRILLEVDDAKITTTAFMTLITNIGGRDSEETDTFINSLQDGLLDVCVFKEAPTQTTLRKIADSMGIRPIHHPLKRHFSCASIYLEAFPPVAVQLDGDYFCQTPVQIDVVPHALNILIP